MLGSRDRQHRFLPRSSLFSYNKLFLVIVLIWFSGILAFLWREQPVPAKHEHFNGMASRVKAPYRSQPDGLETANQPERPSDPFVTTPKPKALKRDPNFKMAKPAFVILAHSRPEYLQVVLKSLASQPVSLLAQLSLYVSCDDATHREALAGVVNAVPFPEGITLELWPCHQHKPRNGSLHTPFMNEATYKVALAFVVIRSFFLFFLLRLFFLLFLPLALSLLV